MKRHIACPPFGSPAVSHQEARGFAPPPCGGFAFVVSQVTIAGLILRSLCELLSKDCILRVHQCIRPPLPEPTGQGRPTLHGLPTSLDTVFFCMLKCGCPWRLLPHDFPPCKTVYDWVGRWRIDGTWGRLDAELPVPKEVAEVRARAKEDIEVEWRRPMPPRGFRVLARRWVVERTFALICHNRRMANDYEGLFATGEVFV